MFLRGLHKGLLITLSGALFLSSELIAFAQEEVDLESLKAELSQSHKAGKDQDAQVPLIPGAEEKAAQGTQGATAAQLHQEEQEILDKLSTLDNGATLAAVAPAASKGPEDKKAALRVGGDFERNEIANSQSAKELEKSQQTVSRLQKNNNELKGKSDELRRALEAKTKELEETRNRLVIAETQVERLSSIIESQNKKKLSSYFPPSASQSAVAPSLPQPSNGTARTVPQAQTVSQTRSADDSLIGVVVAKKAFLRSGPSKEDAPLMTVSNGTRLVVETRHGDFYQVITPTGSRAWISTDMLNFGPGMEAGSNSALRIGGYDQSRQ